MTRIVPSTNREAIVLTAMIVNTDVLTRVSQQWKPNLLSSKAANLVGDLCIHYFENYSSAPGKNIENLVRNWGEDKQESPELELVESLLSNLSYIYQKSDEINVQQILDIFDQHVRFLNTKRAITKAQDFLDASQLEEAENILREYTFQKEEGVAEESSTYLLNETKEIKAAFDLQKEEQLINFYGDLSPLQEFWGNTLQREMFVTFIAPEGTGKSWWLMDLAYRAITQRKKVAFFEVGDMSKRQTIMRWCLRIAKRPRKPGEFLFPRGVDNNGAFVRTNKKYKKGISLETTINSVEKLLNNTIRSKQPYLHLDVTPAGTTTVASIEAKLRKLQKKDRWIPDIICIDYADLLAPSSKRMETRDQINDIWINLRALSMKTHTLLLTATQCNREGYDTKMGLRLKHISEEKRKASHATHVIGINVSDADKTDGIMKLNMLKGRDMDFTPSRFVYCAGCLAIGQPAIVARFEGWK